MTSKKITSIEFLKLKRRGNFILLALMLLVYIGGSAIEIYQFEKGQNIISFVKTMNSMAESLIGFFLVIFIIMNIGNEYSEGTLRKNIIDGYTRSQFFTGKLLLLLVITIGAYILGKFTLLIGGVVLNNFQNVLALFTPSFLINSFIKLLYSGIFALCLIYLTRNTTISIVIYFIWGTIENIVILLGHFKKNMDPGLERFMPLTSIGNVLTTTELITISSIIISVVYVFVMLFLPYYFLLKRDIK